MIPKGERRRLSRIAADLYVKRMEMILEADQIVDQADQTDDPERLAHLKSKYDLLAARVRETGSVADRIECELIWELPVVEPSREG